MIKEFEFYHGVVFSMLFHYCKAPFKVEQYPSSDNASYVVNDAVGTYIKYSTKRMSPWQFFFEKRHNIEISEISRRFRCVILLVCKDDGVVGLTLEEYRRIVDDANETTKWVSAVRRPREKYTIKGPMGKLPYKIGMTDFCEKILY